MQMLDYSETERTMSEFKIEGLSKVRSKMGRLKADRWKRGAIQVSAQTITDEVSAYPPETSANMPGAGRRQWYKRGYGKKWEGGGRATSEDLAQKWYTKISRRSGGWAAEIGNIASYAVYVHGKIQAAFHKMRGWKRLDKTTDRLLSKIVERLQTEVRKILRS